VSPSNIVGRYLNVEEWNELLNESESIIIDTRNQYEVSIGTFKNSINPKIKSFRDFPMWTKKNLIDKKVSKKSKIGMFCTGGIRCEKSTSYLKQLGFENVYHLDGGILKYLENVKPEENEWKGECFVFDYRVSLNGSLQKGEYDMCYACRMPLNKKNKKSGRLENIKKILGIENFTNSGENLVKDFFDLEYKKIILKRPLKYGKNYSNINYQVLGKTTRFDIYL